MKIDEKTIKYIIDFLLDGCFDAEQVFYGSVENAPENVKMIIVPSGFFDEEIFLSPKSLSQIPLLYIDNESQTPLLYGSPKKEKESGRVVLYADLVASSYYLMTRYEEVILKDKRDEHGRFLAKYSLIFQQGYGERPIVDEYGVYLRQMLAEILGNPYVIPKGMKKIYLTHDIDGPYKYEKIKPVIKQLIKNILPNYPSERHVIQSYFDVSKDPFYTFEDIIQYDHRLIKELPQGMVESVYFIITALSNETSEYCNIHTKKYKQLLTLLQEADVSFGLHISYEGGKDASMIKDEVKQLPDCVDKKQLYSRHHYLRWCEPEQITDMQLAGIKEDFTLGYADTVGFRCGTCHPYRFINPVDGKISDVIVHPMQIMECTLNRDCYMGCDYDAALLICKKIIEQIYLYNGELNILFHNTTFADKDFDFTKLYKELIDYIISLENRKV